MSILCCLFGHKPQENVHSGAEYMRVSGGSIDGIGREHWRLWATCARCEVQYAAGKVHGPLEKQTYRFPTQENPHG